jgi:hypothetical protein
MKKEKRKYIAPQLDRRRLVLEEVVAAPMSVGRVSAQLEDWTEVGLGDEEDEGGDIYIMW